MKSKIMVDYDFEKKETFLQLRLEGYDVDGGELPDKHLHSFIEQANKAGGLHIEYNGAGKALPQIRVGMIKKPAFEKGMKVNGVTMIGEKGYQGVIVEIKLTDEGYLYHVDHGESRKIWYPDYSLTKI